MNKSQTYNLLTPKGHRLEFKIEGGYGYVRGFPYYHLAGKKQGEPIKCFSSERGVRWFKDNQYSLKTLRALWKECVKSGEWYAVENKWD